MEALRTKQQKRFAAFSLLEMMVTMMIIAILIPLLSNLLITTMRSSLLLSARTKIREEVSSVSNLIRRDLRNADNIVACGNTGTTLTCTVSVAQELITWKACPGDTSKLCKMSGDATSNLIILQTSDNFRLDRIEFEPGYEISPNTTERNLIVTLVASHRNANLNIKNILFQASVSTRNYELAEL